MRRLGKISCAAFLVASLAAPVAADDTSARFESSGFLQSLDAFIAEQMAKHQKPQPDSKATALSELELSLRNQKGENHSFFKLSDSRPAAETGLKGLTDRPDFSSLLAPTGEMRGTQSLGSYNATSRVAINFGKDRANLSDHSFSVALESSYRLSSDGLPAAIGLSGNDLASRQYNLGIVASYLGFGLDASLMQQNSVFDKDLSGFDVGLSYQTNSWAARLSLSEYKAGADLFGIENEVRNIISVELGASYRLTDSLGLKGGVRYYDYGDRWLMTPESGENSRMIFLGGRLRF